MPLNNCFITKGAFKLKISFNTWLKYALTILDILDELNIDYALFGAVAFSLLVKPLSTKDIDILVYPFPNEIKALSILNQICAKVKCIKSSIEIDALEGNRIIIGIDTEEGPLSIELWEKILRRDPMKILTEKIEITYKKKQIKILKPEALLATKICDLTPEPLDKDKIEGLIRKMRKQINLDEVINIILRLNHEVTAVINLIEWYPRKLPQYAKYIIKKLLPYLSTHIKNEILKRLESTL